MLFIKQLFILLIGTRRSKDERLPILLIAITLIVCTFSSASLTFFSKSVQVALDKDIAEHLGAPLVIRSERPLSEDLLNRYDTADLVHTQAYTTGATSGSSYQSVSVKGVTKNYPLTGKLIIRVKWSSHIGHSFVV